MLLNVLNRMAFTWCHEILICTYLYFIVILHDYCIFIIFNVLTLKEYSNLAFFLMFMAKSKLRRPLLHRKTRIKSSGQNFNFIML